MVLRTSQAARFAAIGILACSAVEVHAADGGFFEMLFGLRPAPAAMPAPSPLPDGRADYRYRRHGSGRLKLRTRYAALPVKIHVSERQTPLDMSQGATAALLRDETLRPGDIVVLKTGARVFAGKSGGKHALADFEPVQNSAYVDRKTRKLLAGMTRPAGTLPAEEARRVVARLRKGAPPASAPVVRSAEIRIVSPWRTAP